MWVGVVHRSELKPLWWGTDGMNVGDLLYFRKTDSMPHNLI